MSQHNDDTIRTLRDILHRLAAKRAGFLTQTECNLMRRLDRLVREKKTLELREFKLKMC